MNTENEGNESNENLEDQLGPQNEQGGNASTEQGGSPEEGKGEDTIVPSDNESPGANEEQAPPPEGNFNEGNNDGPKEKNPDEDEEEEPNLDDDNAIVEPPEGSSGADPQGNGDGSLGNDIGEGPNAIGPDLKEFEEDEVVEMSAISKIKEQRIKLDKIEQFHKGRTLISFGDGKSVFLAKAWLGKLLAQLGAENPYAGEDKLKKVQDIPPTAQKAEGQDLEKERYQFGLLSSLDATLKLRKELGEVITEIEAIDLSEEEVKDGRLAAIAKTQFYVHASEARFNLGMVLASIRK